MTASVKLSLRAAQALLSYRPLELTTSREWGELSDAIARAERASKTRARLAKPKREKKATKREETVLVRVLVMARADGRCESCGASAVPLELDHQHGRGKAPQSRFNCRALCLHCHREKTLSRPSAAHWLEDFIQHAERHGYTAEAKRARARLAFVEARGTP